MKYQKDYDSTLARIAGNVASGLVGTPHFQHRDGVVNHQELSAVSVDIAKRIIAVCRPPSTEELTQKLKQWVDYELSLREFSMLTVDEGRAIKSLAEVIVKAMVRT